MQDGSDRPLAYASRVLKTAEKRYAQIEREGLAIIFGLSKFNQDLYGNHFYLETDNKALTYVFNPSKGIPEFSANRVRRWATILANYNYQISYVKSSLNKADFLSRLPVDNPDENWADVDPNYIYYFSNVTKQDKILSKILNFVKDGRWPSYAYKENDYKYFASKRFELSIESNALLWNHRVIVPTKLRSKLLNKLHESHLGIVKMKSTARSYFWWPKIDRDIENYIKNCESCKMNQPNPPRSVLSPWPWPEKPWQRIHLDFAGPLRNTMYLIIVDAHSKWLEVLTMKSTTSEMTRETFARFGLPEVVVSDQGTQFKSNQFQTFLAKNGIIYIDGPARHAQSNGQAESSVKVIKTALKKLIQDNFNDTDYALSKFLFDYRNSIHSTTGVTPSELMFRHKIRSQFRSILPPCSPVVKEKVKCSQLKQKSCFKGQRTVCFVPGERVLVRKFSEK
ncbi:uncharacterized protein K02A2.6-like isoform X1 [Harmonia axyridis]|uniref:uncharacterized protein K02A2.6-like isoform X1 n=1 Tax=Harmonia axyridis TaxID=115357 RepID=UPI001E276335|nr:uncharacterized protein K02A2.6-like isoform X1 [Harmonia axyridis]